MTIPVSSTQLVDHQVCDDMESVYAWLRSLTMVQGEPMAHYCMLIDAMQIIPTPNGKYGVFVVAHMVNVRIGE